MIFSNMVFIFFALPLALGGYYLLRSWRTAQNVWLLLISLFFYAWGEPYFVLLMILSITINYILGILISLYRQDERVIRIVLTLNVLFNMGLLFIFKYLGFTVFNLQKIGIPLATVNIVLPIGISFYTFQAMSYVIDVYRGDGEVQKNPLNVGLYIAFFPQLIAGPIVRYSTIAEQITHRIENIDDFCVGIKRFVYGLSKKLLLANSFATFADYAFNNISRSSTLTAWIGALCYSFQIFFDFSGYSDMAIGLGKMFGFQFLENFDYPYISKSVSEFWRRWHISLGTWFRDYVYFPLGGSRVDKKRLFFNLLVVWFLTGVWHGANWTFVVWGLWYFMILCFEKFFGYPERVRSDFGKFIYRIFTLLCVVIGWIIFRAPSLPAAVDYLKTMAGVTPTPLIDDIGIFILKDLILLLIIGAIASTPIIKKIGIKIEKKAPGLCSVISSVGIVMLFCISISYSVNARYNPFIYFNF